MVVHKGHIVLPFRKAPGRVNRAGSTKTAKKLFQAKANDRNRIHFPGTGSTDALRSLGVEKWQAQDEQNQKSTAF
jgi:hypothetical protein